MFDQEGTDQWTDEQRHVENELESSGILRESLRRGHFNQAVEQQHAEREPARPKGNRADDHRRQRRRQAEDQGVHEGREGHDRHQFDCAPS